MGDCEKQHERDDRMNFNLCNFCVKDDMKWQTGGSVKIRNPEHYARTAISTQNIVFFPISSLSLLFLSGMYIYLLSFSFFFGDYNSVFLNMCALSIITESSSLLLCNSCVFVSSVLRWTKCNVDLGYLKQLKGSVCFVCQSLKKKDSSSWQRGVDFCQITSRKSVIVLFLYLLW